MGNASHFNKKLGCLNVNSVLSNISKEPSFLSVEENPWMTPSTEELSLTKVFVLKINLYILIHSNILEHTGIQERKRKISTWTNVSFRLEASEA